MVLTVPSAQTVAAMRALRVVEHEEPVQRPLQGRGRAEVVPTKRNAPVFMQNRALQALHESVGPRMPRLRPRVAHLVVGTGGDEPGLELLAVVGQHARQAPACAPIAREDDLGQKGRHQRRGDLAPHDPPPAKRRGAIAGRQLPDLADPLQLVDVETVQRTQVAHPLRPARRPRQRLGDDPTLVRHAQRGRAPRTGCAPRRMQSVGPILFEPSSPSIEHRARYIVAATRRAHIATPLRFAQNPQTEPLYAVVEGHWAPPFRRLFAKRNCVEG